MQYLPTSQSILINCKESLALESQAMPKYTSLLHIRGVTLNSCPLPDVPLITIFERLNFTISQNNESYVCLEGTMPPETKITEKHFQGLDNLPRLCIKASSSQDPAVIYKIINKFNNLTYLKFSGMSIDVNLIPHSVTQIAITNSEILPLTQMLEKLRFLKALALFQVNTSLSLDTNDHNKDEGVVSNLETLWLSYWKERHVSPMEYCDNLRKLHLGSPEVESIPENWIAACTQLEILEIFRANNLISLPEKLLKDAARLKKFSIMYSKLKSVPNGLLDDAEALEHLTIARSKLESLPDGFLKGALNLKSLNLSINELKTISSTALSGPGLIDLNLSFNDLDNRVLDMLATQISLISLNIEGNDRLTLDCDDNYKSRLSSLKRLRRITVTVSMYYLRHLCSDLEGRTKLASRMIIMRV